MKRIFFLLAIWCMALSYGQAQMSSTKSGKPIEDLRLEYKKAMSSGDDQSVFDALSGIHKYFSSKMKYDSSYHYNSKLAELSLAMKDYNDYMRRSTRSISIAKVMRWKSNKELEEDVRKLYKEKGEMDLNPETLMSLEFQMSEYYSSAAKYDSAIITQIKAVENIDKLDTVNQERMIMRSLLSKKYLSVGKYLEAINTLLEADRISENVKDEERYSNAKIKIWTNLGEVFKNIEDFDKSFYYYNKALLESQTAKYASYENGINLFLGQLHLMQKKSKEAREYLLKSKSGMQASRLKALLPTCYEAIAHSYLIDGESRLAKEYIDSALVVYKKVNKDPAHYYYELAIDYYSSVGNTAKVKALLLEMDVKGQLNVDVPGLYEKVFYKAMRNSSPDEALQFFEKYIETKDSITRANNTIKVQRLESEFNRKEQDAEIKSLSLITAAQDKELAVRNTALTLGSIMLLILGGLLFGLYRLYKENQQSQKTLSEQNVVITKALSENQILIKEIHHRVKNNLQVISSLLSMQARKVSDESTKDALNSSKTRVQSMSILHQNLYQGENLKDVEVDQYIDKLIENIVDTYKIQDHITYEVEVDPISLDVDTLVPLGLISNELVCNALKYAFEGRESGKLIVSLKEKGDKIILRVADDGIGFEGDELPMKEGSLGAKLIKSFAHRLEGEIVIDKNHGTDFQIHFNKKSLLKP